MNTKPRTVSGFLECVAMLKIKCTINITGHDYFSELSCCKVALFWILFLLLIHIVALLDVIREVSGYE